MRERIDGRAAKPDTLSGRRCLSIREKERKLNKQRYQHIESILQEYTKDGGYKLILT